MKTVFTRINLAPSDFEENQYTYPASKHWWIGDKKATIVKKKEIENLSSHPSCINK